MADDTRTIGHTKPALEEVIDRWTHTHAENPQGNVICFVCMAQLLLSIHDMVYKDSYPTPSGGAVVA